MILTDRFVIRFDMSSPPVNKPFISDLHCDLIRDFAEKAWQVPHISSIKLKMVFSKHFAFNINYAIFINLSNIVLNARAVRVDSYNFIVIISSNTPFSHLIFICPLYFFTTLSMLYNPKPCCSFSAFVVGGIS